MRHLSLPIPSFSTALDRLFDDVFKAPAVEPRSTPLVDIWEDADAYGLSVELPGFTLADLELTLQDGELRLHAKRSVPAKGASEATDAPDATGEVAAPGESDRTWLRRERVQRDFARTIGLPSDVDSSAAEAKFVNGVLEITLPKSEAAKPRRIPVR